MSFIYGSVQFLHLKMCMKDLPNFNSYIFAWAAAFVGPVMKGERLPWLCARGPGRQPGGAGGPDEASPPGSPPGSPSL